MAARQDMRGTEAGVGLVLGTGIGGALGVLVGPDGLVVGAGLGAALGLVVGAAVAAHRSGPRPG